MVTVLGPAARPRTSGGAVLRTPARESADPPVVAEPVAAEPVSAEPVTAGPAIAEPVGTERLGAVSRWRHALVESAWLAGVGLCAFAVVLAFGLLAAKPVEPVPNTTDLVSVSSGDTLPGLAARFAPDSDQGAVVRRIVELNHLDAAEPATGRSLVVPVRRD